MTAFLVIGGIGILLLIVSFLAGETFEGVFDAIGGGDFLSIAAVAGFLSAFGFGGALALDAGLGTGAAAGAGVAAGAVVGAFAGYLTKAPTNSPTDDAPRSADLTGREGTVISAVPADGYGEISLVVSGHITKLNARGDSPLAVGTPVTVTSVLSPTAVIVSRR